jgi:hypothetical protein
MKSLIAGSKTIIQPFHFEKSMQLDMAIHGRRDWTASILTDSSAQAGNDRESGGTVVIEIMKKETLDETEDAQLIWGIQKKMRFRHDNQISERHEPTIGSRGISDANYKWMWPGERNLRSEKRRLAVGET